MNLLTSHIKRVPIAYAILSEADGSGFILYIVTLLRQIPHFVQNDRLFRVFFILALAIHSCLMRIYTPVNHMIYSALKFTLTSRVVVYVL